MISGKHALTLGVALLAVGPAAVLVELAVGAAEAGGISAPSGALHLTIAFYRMVVATVVVASLVLLRGRRDLAGLSDGGSLRWSVAAGAFLGVHFATWIASLAFIPVATSVILVSTQPVFAALLGAFLLRERVPGAMAGAIGLALLGTAVISWSPMGEGHLVGALLAISGAAAGSAYLVAGRRVRRRVSTLGYVFVAYGTAALVVGSLALAWGSPLVGLPPAAWGWIIASGIGPSVIGHTLYNRALEHFSAHAISTAILGEPVVATALAWCVLGEVPGVQVWIGAVPLVLGVVWALRIESKS